MNKILIIDDDRELCALIKRSVQAENIEADFCNTGKEGLQKLKEQEYQLVVLDVMMPGMDGFETLEEIRKENSLPILMFTSKNDSISKVRGLRAGADDYLTKPFDMDELIARIASLIRRYTRFNHQAGAVQKLDFDGLQIDLENRSVTTANGTFELPPKEFDLLLYCAKHQGKILTKQQIYAFSDCAYLEASTLSQIVSTLYTLRAELLMQQRFFVAAVACGTLNASVVDKKNLYCQNFSGADISRVYVAQNVLKGIGISIDSTIISKQKRNRMLL